MKKSIKRTDFLFPKRSFWTGVGSVIGIYIDKDQVNSSKSGEDADKKAIASDWEMVGEDFRNTLKEEVCEW